MDETELNKDYLKLRECPFCGSEAVFCHIKELGNPYYKAFKVQCTNCGAENSIHCESKEEASKLWNTRYEPPFNGSVPAGNARLQNEQSKNKKSI